MEVRAKKSVFLVLHDQLNQAYWPQPVKDKQVPLLFLESVAKGRSLPYHKKKLVFVLSAQRHFARACSSDGYRVVYRGGLDHYDGLLLAYLRDNPETIIETFEPAEHDTRDRLARVAAETGRLSMMPNPFFLARSEPFADKIRNGWRMEFFYRTMRQTTGLLMEGDHPSGGRWNFDAENRRRLPAGTFVPPAPAVAPDAITQRVMELVEQTFPDHPGSTEGFNLPVTASQAQEALGDFITNRLPMFGPYEDALSASEPLLFHSALSTVMNAGLLLPMDVCRAAEKAWQEGRAPLESVEGFIRQIIGWREFVRLYYEAMMPGVRKANALGAHRGLDQSYWTGKSSMRCIRHCAGPVLDTGYTHHIARLMVLSNFAVLTETDPAEILHWFHAFFTDAYEWVVLPNVLGMSTFADGGVLASKPYVSAAAYIKKMSDFCGGCAFNPAERTGPGACPFNFLYWHFVNRHRAVFSGNGRVSFAVSTFDRFTEDEKARISLQAEAFISALPRYPKAAVFSAAHGG